MQGCELHYPRLQCRKKTSDKQRCQLSVDFKVPSNKHEVCTLLIVLETVVLLTYQTNLRLS